MIFRKIRKNIKAISPIISMLLMIAIAVVASLVVYAWVMGYIGYQTGKTGDAVQIQSVTFTSTRRYSGTVHRCISSKILAVPQLLLNQVNVCTSTVHLILLLQLRMPN